MREYESYINSEIMESCINAYVKGDKTQKYYCDKFGVNYHSFMKHFKEYKLIKNKDKPKKNNIKGGNFSDKFDTFTEKSNIQFSETSTHNSEKNNKENTIHENLQSNIKQKKKKVKDVNAVFNVDGLLSKIEKDKNY